MAATRLFRLLTAAAVAAVCLLLIGVVVADARIVLQKGIAGADLGMSKKRVVNKLGRPDRTRIQTNPFSGGDYIELKYGRTWVSFDGTENLSEVFNVSTKDHNQRTAGGVGVGSTKRQVKKGVKGVKCANEFGVRHCYVGEFLPFETVTDFRLKKPSHKPARVKSVGVGIVQD